MSRARGRWCLLLNEDSELTPGAADALRDALERDPRAAVAGARLVIPGRSTRSRRPGGSRASGPRSPAPLFLHRRLTVQSRGELTREVDWVQSAGMLVRREAFEQVGPLDPAFFVYSDEVDWQRRARDAGWSVLYVPGRDDHAPRAALAETPASERRIVEFARNRDTYVRKHHGRLAALAVRALTAWSLRAARAGRAWCCPATAPGATRGTRTIRCSPAAARGCARQRTS